MGPGFYPNINRQVFIDLDAMSNTRISDARKSLYTYWYYKTNDREQTKEMEFGAALHAAILEPHRLWVGDKRTKAAKHAEADGLVTASRSDKKKIDLMLEGLQRSDPLSANIAKKLKQKESAIVWDCPYTGIRCKGLIDGVYDGRIVDFKTASSAHPRDFLPSFEKWGYFTQMAFYFDGFNQAGMQMVKNPILVAMEKWPPYHAKAYQLTDTDLQAGRSEYARLLRKIQDADKTGKYPGYEDAINVKSGDSADIAVDVPKPLSGGLDDIL